MQLVICILKDSRHLEPVIQGMLDIEVGGATIIEATGMAELIRAEMSLFAGFRNLFPNTGHSRIVLALVSDRQARALVDQLRRICSGEDDVGKGIVFTVPVADAFRLGNAALPTDEDPTSGRLTDRQDGVPVATEKTTSSSSSSEPNTLRTDAGSQDAAPE